MHLMHPLVYLSFLRPSPNPIPSRELANFILILPIHHIRLLLSSIGHSSIQSHQSKQQTMKLYAFQVKPSLTTRPTLHFLKSSHSIRAQFTLPKSLSKPQPKPRNLQSQQPPLLESSNNVQMEKLINSTQTKTQETEETLQNLPDAIPRWFLIGGASLGIAFLVLGLDDHREAMALGPEGPLVEEFWDNMRRYALYALTVSTGMAYTVLEPIVALLKNPVTAILILIVVVGSGFLVSQVLNAMVGNSDFAYNYAY